MGLVGLVALIVVLVAAQLILPTIAARQIRGTLNAHGHVTSVSVSAFPAVKLLWRRADSVKVRMSEIHVNVSQSGELLGTARETTRLDLRAERLTVGPMTLRGVTLTKRGDALTASGSADQSDLSAALPTGFSVQPVASANGELILRASASLFGVGVAANAALEARDGRLIIQPVGIPFGGLVSFTVYADPHLDIQGVGASGGPSRFVFSARAQLH